MKNGTEIAAFVSNCYDQDSPAAAKEDEALSKVKGQRMRIYAAQSDTHFGRG